jgi:hypothetical protein
MIVRGSGPTRRGAAAPDQHRWLLLSVRHSQLQLPKNYRGELKCRHSLKKG